MSVTGRVQRWASARSIISLGLAVLISLALLVSVGPAAAASPCGPPVVNAIACENSLPGDPPSDWRVSGAGDPAIQGFAASASVSAGQSEYFKINTASKSYHFDILRVGHYGGDGARLVAEGLLPTATLPQSQPACKKDSTPTGLTNCGNWAVSASWLVPPNAVPGLYLAHVKRNDASKGNGSLIPFIVRSHASHHTAPPTSTITSPASGRHPVPRFGRHHQRDRQRRARRGDRRRRDIDQWRCDLASSNQDVRRPHRRNLELFVEGPRQPRNHDRNPGRRRQRQPGELGAAPSRST